MKPTINFIFGIGYRCYSPDFLNTYNLRKIGSPFDHIFIDFETSLKIINNKFDCFLHDIILFNKKQKKIELFLKKNTNEINKNLYEFLENDIDMVYMGDNFTDNIVLFNQNYLDDAKLNNNLYNWNTICCFIHHDRLDNYIHRSIKQRCERFNNVINKYNKSTALFYMTKIINCDNIVYYMNGIIELKKKYDIELFMIIIINCDNIEDCNFYNELDEILFIVKKVESYEIQYSKYKTDNNLNNYEKEFNVILNYFTLNILCKI